MSDDVTPRLPRLMVITDRAQLQLGRGLLRTLRECAEAGLELVLVREHDLDPDCRRALLTELVTIDGLTVLSSRLTEPTADGLHLAAAQPPPRGPAQPWGRSCHRVDDVWRAAEQGATWATLSPFAETPSKPDYGPVLPPESFADLPLPTYALAGITPDNAPAALAAGAYGVAVMGEVMRAPEPATAVEALLEVLR